MPPKPDGIDVALSYRLTGLTPSEHGKEDATRWIEAVQIVNAYHEGVESARIEAQSFGALARARPGQVG